MRVEITQKGVHDAEGNKIPVGEEITVEGDTMPGWLVGKAIEVKERKGKTAVTNPANGAVQEPTGPQPSAQERQQLLGEAAKVIDGESFLNDGRPDVRAINDLLKEDVKPFDAAERDQLWPGIADAVNADREAKE